MRIFLPALFLVLSCAAAQAQTVRGAGARPCAEWNQARVGGGRAFEAEQWALGYLSGLNAGGAGKPSSVFRVLDERGAFAGIDAYCTRHPTEMLWNAVRSVTAAHGV